MLSKKKLLENKTILIPNAARCGSLAYEIVCELAAESPNLIVTSRKKSNLEAKEHFIKAGAADVLAVPVDFYDQSAILACLDKANERFGSIDALILCSQASVAGTNFETLKSSQLELSYKSGPVTLFNWLQACSQFLIKSHGKAFVCLLDDAVLEFVGLPLSLAQGASRSLCAQVNTYLQKHGAKCEVIETLCLTKNFRKLCQDYPGAYEKLCKHLQEKNIASLMSVHELAAKLISKIIL